MQPNVELHFIVRLHFRMHEKWVKLWQKLPHNKIGYNIIPRHGVRYIAEETSNGEFWRIYAWRAQNPALFKTSQWSGELQSPISDFHIKLLNHIIVFSPKIDGSSNEKISSENLCSCQRWTVICTLKFDPPFRKAFLPGWVGQWHHNFLLRFFGGVTRVSVSEWPAKCCFSGHKQNIQWKIAAKNIRGEHRKSHSIWNSLLRRESLKSEWIGHDVTWEYFKWNQGIQNKNMKLNFSTSKHPRHSFLAFDAAVRSSCVACFQTQTAAFIGILRRRPCQSAISAS